MCNLIASKLAILLLLEFDVIGLGISYVYLHARSGRLWSLLTCQSVISLSSPGGALAQFPSVPSVLHNCETIQLSILVCAFR